MQPVNFFKNTNQICKFNKLIENLMSYDQLLNKVYLEIKKISWKCACVCVLIVNNVQQTNSSDIDFPRSLTSLKVKFLNLWPKRMFHCISSATHFDFQPNGLLIILQGSEMDAWEVQRAQGDSRSEFERHTQVILQIEHL